MVRNLARRKGLIVLGSLLIVAGAIIPFMYFSAHYSLQTGQVVSYDFPLLPYGATVGILGVIVLVIGLTVRDETTSASHRSTTDDD
jgi:hypothetical protein